MVRASIAHLGFVAMTLNTCTIPLQEDSTGAIRVENTRLTLDAIVFAFREGATAEEIVERFPAISLSAVYAAIAFYLQNRVQVDEYLARRKAEADEIRIKIESRPETKAFRERLLARMSGNGLS
jgi:uncharacterized protein (DUF433 family)